MSAAPPGPAPGERSELTADRGAAEPPLDGRWQQLLSLLPVAVLLLAFPISRQLSPLFLYTGGERLWVAALELAFVFLCLSGWTLGRGVPLSRAWRPLPAVARALLIAWIFWGAFAVLASRWPAAALLRQAEWMLHGTFAWVLWAELQRSARHPRWLALAIPLGFLLWLVWLVVFALSLDAPGQHDWTNLPPGFHNIRHVDYYACAALLAAAMLRLERRHPWPLIALFVVLWTVIVWTGSRGVLLTLFGTCLVLALARLHPGFAWRCGWLAATGVAGGAVSRLFRVESTFLGLEYAIGQSVTGLTTEGSVSRKLTHTTGGRWAEWEQALAEIADRPIFGLGPDGYSFLPLDIVQPHNLPLQASLEWGLPGALLFGGLLGWLLVAGARHVRATRDDQSDTRRVGYAVLLGLVGYSAIDGTLYSAFPLALCGCGAALALQPALPSRHAARGDGVASGIAVTLAVLLASVFALHAVVAAGLARDEVPSPDEFAPRVVRAFPTRIESPAHVGGVFFWALEWSESDPALAIDWLHWSHEHARRPWAHYQLEARLLWQQGRRREAREHVAEAAAAALSPGQLLRSRALERAMQAR